MTAVVCLSAAGPHGERLAAALARVLRLKVAELGGALSVVLSNENRVGTESFPHLLSELRRADFAIALIEPAALETGWVAFEMGVVSAREGTEGQRRRIVPFVLRDSVDLLQNTPFQARQVAFLSEQGLRLLAADVLGWAKPNAVDEEIDELGREIHKALVPDWDAIQRVERQKNSDLVGRLESLVEVYERFGLASPDTAGRLRSLHAALGIAPNDVSETSLAEELALIAQGFEECSRKGDFGDLGADWALRHWLHDTRTRLTGISRGILEVDTRPPIIDFWVDSIIGKARRSIWTTNAERPGANMGGSVSPHLLNVQVEALRRGVEITRLFIYDPEMLVSEAERRRAIMKQQVEAGIEVRVITEKDYALQAQHMNAIARIGSNDFMIIDERFVYVTYADENSDVHAKLYNDEDNRDRLEVAQTFRTSLEGWSDRITGANLGKFPGILA